MLLLDYSLIVGTIGISSYLLSKIHLPAPKIKSPYILYCGKIPFNMKLTPHILVAGLSGQGKSMFVQSLLIGRDDIKVTLLNVFRDDMRGIKGRRINSLNGIKSYLETLLNEPSDIPEYIVIDELLALSIADKSISKIITKILAVARHFNKFLICISQSATKEEVGSKQLFNTRICFRMVDQSSYQTILGYSPENKQLNIREFYYLSDKQGLGKVPLM